MKLRKSEVDDSILKLELDLSDERLVRVEGVAFTDPEATLEGIEGEPVLSRCFHVWGDRRPADRKNGG